MLIKSFEGFFSVFVIQRARNIAFMIFENLILDCEFVSLFPSFATEDNGMNEDFDFLSFFLITFLLLLLCLKYGGFFIVSIKPLSSLSGN